MKQIPTTPALMDAIQRYEEAYARFKPGIDSASDVELPLLAIATALVEAIGLPTLRSLFGVRVPTPKAKPAKATLAPGTTRRRA